MKSGNYLFIEPTKKKENQTQVRLQWYRDLSVECFRNETQEQQYYKGEFGKKVS